MAKLTEYQKERIIDGIFEDMLTGLDVDMRDDIEAAVKDELAETYGLDDQYFNLNEEELADLTRKQTQFYKDKIEKEAALGKGGEEEAPDF